mmetsp:Transcript_103379/g.246184  ORF Transcript_103379/g.246184 Transcript_103379/m.246184 type:complete len:218 (+) Transcript_103379:895-1548(+)
MASHTAGTMLPTSALPSWKSFASCSLSAATASSKGSTAPLSWSLSALLPASLQVSASSPSSSTAPGPGWRLATCSQMSSAAALRFSWSLLRSSLLFRSCCTAAASGTSTGTDIFALTLGLTTGSSSESSLGAVAMALGFGFGFGFGRSSTLGMLGASSLAASDSSSWPKASRSAIARVAARRSEPSKAFRIFFLSLALFPVARATKACSTAWHSFGA